MQKFLLGCFFLFFPLICCAEIYKWTDANGVVHYSDTPQLGAASVSLSSVQSYHSTPVMQSKKSVTKSEAAQLLYSSVKITHPSNNYLYPNNAEGKMVVEVVLQPTLQEGNYLQVLLDEKPFGQSQTSTSIILSDIERGQHHLQIQVLDKKRNVLALSNDVIFFMSRPHEK